jgi:hypothetical protein
LIASLPGVDHQIHTQLTEGGAVETEELTQSALATVADRRTTDAPRRGNPKARTTVTLASEQRKQNHVACWHANAISIDPLIILTSPDPQLLRVGEPATTAQAACGLYGGGR